LLQQASSSNRAERERARIASVFAQTRARTDALSARLSPEDQQLQSMPDASPAKWHRAHTTWFFETFVLAPAGLGKVDERYDYLFNSYYDAVGARHPRARRGMLSRPTAAQVGDYRRIVDERMTQLLATAAQGLLSRILPVVELGIAHEEQHQELLLTDILHAFSESPLRPAFQEIPPEARTATQSGGELRFVPFEGGLRQVGAPPGASFVFDNETPLHKYWLEPFELSDRLVTFGELKAFILADGYRTPSLWLAEGLDLVRANHIEAPLHCTFDDGVLSTFTLAGTRQPADDEPVAHVSYYEADAIARFMGARLPTEMEWEIAAAQSPVLGNFVDDGVLHTLPTPPAGGATSVRQLFGDAWEWTRSSYEAYPGYEPPAGALGEYNGKFMVGQRVLRGGSCLTPQRHVRTTYRNFWPPHTRFQMAGIRLAREIRT
jgi:ergothioneine biosynthesis protein EgtB